MTTVIDLKLRGKMMFVAAMILCIAANIAAISFLWVTVCHSIREDLPGLREFLAQRPAGKLSRFLTATIGFLSALGEFFSELGDLLGILVPITYLFRAFGLGHWENFPSLFRDRGEKKEEK
jgi:hypothetical protein